MSPLALITGKAFSRSDNWWDGLLLAYFLGVGLWLSSWGSLACAVLLLVGRVRQVTGYHTANVHHMERERSGALS